MKLIRKYYWWAKEKAKSDKEIQRRTFNDADYRCTKDWSGRTSHHVGDMKSYV